MHLREIQAKRTEKMREAARQSAIKASGFDPADIDWYDPSFSINGLREACVKMREATSASAMGQLLRAGVSTFMFDAYQAVPTVYQDLVTSVSSTKAEELYAPLYNSELPLEMLPSDPFPDSRILGIDVHVRNRKFGRMITFERELFDDDQTGQIAQRAGNLGEMMRYVEELNVMSAIINAKDPITGASAYSTTIGNQPASPGQLSQPGLEAADIALQNMLDPLGNFLLVMPDTVLVSPADKFNVLKLLNSTLQPSVPGSSGQNAGTASSGGTGWTMTVNPLQGEYAPKISRFLPGATSTQGGPGLTGPGLDGSHGAVFLLQAGKATVFQDRDALEIMQEAPTGGTAFEVDQYRYRVRRRFNVAVLDGRFSYRLN
jgi:hypothetical protein